MRLIGTGRRSRTALTTLLLVIVVITAGCSGLGGDAGPGANVTTDEATAEPTPEPTDEPTPEPTPEPTDAPPATDAPSGGGGDGGDGSGEQPANDRTLLWVGILAVFTFGLVVAGVLRGRNRGEPTPARSEPAPATATAPAEVPQSDADRIISLLHENNGRMFEDVLEETLDWSPAHARRAVAGLIATGDIERRETASGVLLVFADPDRQPDDA